MTVSSAYLFACLKSWYAYFQESLISFPVGDQKYQIQPSKKASNAVALSDEQSWADPAPTRQSTKQSKLWTPTLLLKLSLHTLGVVLDILVTSSVPHDTDDCADNDGSSSNELQNRRSDFNLLYPFCTCLAKPCLLCKAWKVRQLWARKVDFYWATRQQVLLAAEAGSQREAASLQRVQKPE